MKHAGKCSFSDKLVNEGDYCFNHSRIENRKCKKTCGYWIDLKLKDKQRQIVGRKAYSACLKINPSNPIAVAENIEKMYQVLLDCQNLAKYHSFKGLENLIYEIKKGE